MPLAAVEPLSARHRLEGFDCGKHGLNDWLQRYALASHQHGGSRVFVACEGDDVMGYYALATGAVAFRNAPAELQERLSAHYPVSVLILTRLAVDRRVQGLRVGESLLLDALLRSLAVSREAGAKALVVHALDEAARGFYERYRFARFPGEPLHLFMTMANIEASLAG